MKTNSYMKGIDNMEFNFWKIDKSMGESRISQIGGAVLLVSIILASIFYSNEIKSWVNSLLN